MSTPRGRSANDQRPADTHSALRPIGPRAGKLEKPKNARATLNRLVNYFRGQRVVLTLVGGCVVAYSGLGLVGPYLMGLALDRFVAARDATGLGRIVFWML